jgi:hypothetical protein
MVDGAGGQRAHGDLPACSGQATTRTTTTDPADERWRIEGPPHDSLLHRHFHEDRPPGTVPHSHLHPVLPGEDGMTHLHLHRHVYDLPALREAGT